MVLYITSMVPDLSLGKILYLQSQAEDVESDSVAKQVLADSLNNEESISAVDYFVLSLVNVIEDIKMNGLLSELSTKKEESNRIVGRLDLARQISSHPSYDSFCVERTVSTTNILLHHYGLLLINTITCDSISQECLCMTTTGIVCTSIEFIITLSFHEETAAAGGTLPLFTQD